MGNLIRNGNTGNLLRKKSTGNLVNMLVDDCSGTPSDCVCCNIGTVLGTAHAQTGNTFILPSCVDCMNLNNQLFDLPQVVLFDACYWFLDLGFICCQCTGGSTLAMHLELYEDSFSNVIMRYMIVGGSFNSITWESASLGAAPIDCNTLGNTNCVFVGSSMCLTDTPVDDVVVSFT